MEYSNDLNQSRQDAIQSDVSNVDHVKWISISQTSGIQNRTYHASCIGMKNSVLAGIML